jgi:hypothetical protein
MVESSKLHYTDAPVRMSESVPFQRAYARQLPYKELMPLAMFMQSQSN